MISNMAAPMWLSTEFQPFLFILLLLLDTLKNACQSEVEVEVEEDILDPYLYHHGPVHRHRHTRAIQPRHYGNITYEIYRAHKSSIVTLPIVETVQISQMMGEYYWDQKLVAGHFFYVHDPAKTVSIIEHGEQDGCLNKKPDKVTNTAKKNGCILATNAGFFNRTDGSCLGDVVSDGRKVQYSGIQNAHFGIRKDGALFFGYLPDDPAFADDFLQLVSGVVWLVRDGKNYVDISLQTESSDTQDTGGLEYFTSVQSARTTVGCDKQGRLVVGHIEGKTSERGVNLREFADLLIKAGIMNAINLDGGGSATTVVNGTIVNYPSDVCTSNTTTLGFESYQCDREVTTVLCVHEPSCSPHNCSGHGDCVAGLCQCHGRWTGIICDQLQCGVTNCSGHGECQEDGCLCHDGWYGESCMTKCPAGWYGYQCRARCRCVHASSCHHETGACVCLPGYTGVLCDQKCPYGFYGADCHQLCSCEGYDHPCSCNHVTGQCNVSAQSSDLMQAAQCLTQKYITDHSLVPSQDDQYRFCTVALVILCIVCTASLSLNAVLLRRSYQFRCTRKAVTGIHHRAKRRNNKKYKSPSLFVSSDTDESSQAATEEEEVSDKNSLKLEKMSKNDMSPDTNIPLLF